MVRHTRIPSFRAALVATVLGVLSPIAWAGTANLDIGIGFGPLRRPPRQLFLALELDYWIQNRDFGFWIALEGNSLGRWAGIGITARMAINSKYAVHLSFGPGIYPDLAHLDLGSKLEFRSSLSLIRYVRPDLYAKLTASHISNGGLSSRNPGAESIRLVLEIPLTRLMHLSPK